MVTGHIFILFIEGHETFSSVPSGPEALRILSRSTERKTCAFFPGGKERIHKGFGDPAAFEGGEEKKLAVFTRIRDEIRGWLEERF